MSWVAVAVTAIIGGGGAFLANQQKNRSIRRAEDSAEQVASIEAGQATTRASQERARRLRESQIIRGRILASAGARGAGGSGDTDLFLGQNEGVTDLDLTSLSTNLKSQLAMIYSQRDAQLSSLDSQRGNDFMSVTQGTLAGASTGMSIGGAINQAEYTWAADAELAAEQQRWVDLNDKWWGDGTRSMP